MIVGLGWRPDFCSQGNAKERKRERSEGKKYFYEETRKPTRATSWSPGFLMDRRGFAFSLEGFPLAGYSLQEKVYSLAEALCLLEEHERSIAINTRESGVVPAGVPGFRGLWRKRR
jgi:hypothetical protein